MDPLQHHSTCACGGRGDVRILPCSHSMCVECIVGGGATGSGPTVCAVMCPRCPRAVELPCLERSSAASCLPRRPTLTSSPVGASHPDDRSRHEQGSRQKASEEDGQSPLEGAVELLEEDMERSVLGLGFALDPSTAHSSLRLCGVNMTVQCKEEFSPEPSGQRGALTSDLTPPTVRGDVVLKRGQYYWEVDVYNSSVYRLGVSSPDGSEHWCLERREASFTALYDGAKEPVHTVPPQIRTVGVFLNVTGGAISFHDALTQERLLTVPTRFDPAGVLPMLAVGRGRLRLRTSLPPPLHVFVCRDSSYRGGGPAGKPRRGIPLRSVRKLIRKFEELAVPDPDPPSTFLPDLVGKVSVVHGSNEIVKRNVLLCQKNSF